MSSILIAVLSWLFCIGLLVFCVYLVSRYPLWFEKNSLRFLVASLVLGLGIYFLDIISGTAYCLEEASRRSFLWQN